MRQLVYDVAASLDGFISGPGDDVSGFLQSGDHVDAYFARMATYDTVVMGRKTYEYGYAFGMKPGDKAYPHMAHHVVSKTLILPAESEVQVEGGDAAALIDRLKAQSGGDIYLCGGGGLAGALLAAGRIDRLIVKLNPVLIGAGIRLFGAESASRPLRRIGATAHESGVVTVEYALIA